MPNYGLVVTPQYNPMTYEQYAKPFEEYGKVYNAMADAYDKLEMEANQWEKLAQNAKDAPQYNQYINYANDLRNAANDLATNGLNPKTRGNLSGLYKRYAQEINPIAEAYAYRQKMADEQRKLNPNGDMQFDIDFSNVGLGEIMANPNLSYKGRKLSDIEKEAYEQAVALSSRRLSDPAKVMANLYYLQTQGFTAEEADNWWKNKYAEDSSAADEAWNFIHDIHEQTRNKYGIYKEGSPYSEMQDEEADQSIVSGILKGLNRKDEYQSNRWVEESGRQARSGGSGDKPEVRPLIYNIDYVKDGKDVTYRYIDKGNGKVELYDINTGAEIKDPGQIKTDSKGNPLPHYARYGVISTGGGTNENSYLVDLLNRDRYTGEYTRLVRKDGQQISYNPTKEYIDHVTLQVVPKEVGSGSTGFIQVISNDGSSASYTRSNFDTSSGNVKSLYQRDPKKSKTRTKVMQQTADEIFSKENAGKLEEALLLEGEERNTAPITERIDELKNLLKERLSVRDNSNAKNFTIRYRYTKGKGFTIVCIPNDRYDVERDFNQNVSFNPNQTSSITQQANKQSDEEGE